MSEYPATLRQIAAWVVESCDPDAPLSRQISLEDIDCDELEAAAAHIEAQDARVARLEASLAKAREALKPFLRECEGSTPFECPSTWPDKKLATGYVADITWGYLRQAAAAYKDTAP